jgi:hypothetical protein
MGHTSESFRDPRSWPTCWPASAMPPGRPWPTATRAPGLSCLRVWRRISGSGRGAVSSVGWGGGEGAVGGAGEWPAALVDRPMVGPAQQGQVGQVGRAAVQPVAQVVGLAPGQGPAAAGEATAAVADGQGGALGGAGDPAAAADLQGLGGGSAQDRGEQGRCGPQPGCQVLVVAGAIVARVVPKVLMAGVAGDQDPGQGAVSWRQPSRPPPQHKHQPRDWGQPSRHPATDPPGQRHGDRTLACPGQRGCS